MGFVKHPCSISAIVLVKCDKLSLARTSCQKHAKSQEFIFIGIFLKFSFKIDIFAFILTAYRLKF